MERDGFAHSPHSISFPLISIRDQLIKTPIYHLLHTVCCSEARALRLGCWEHIILRITDFIQHNVCIAVQENTLTAFIRRVPIQTTRMAHVHRVNFRLGGVEYCRESRRQKGNGSRLLGLHVTVTCCMLALTSDRLADHQDISAPSGSLDRCFLG